MTRYIMKQLEATQEDIIKTLQTDILNLKNKLSEKQKAVDMLQKRCKALTYGYSCVLCDFKKDCQQK